ncbi:MAG: PIN domain-containing protein [Eggerthellaceae bacterium]|nr:PIN domain-containing protein [Eggerthellaceae bacterium]
MIDFLGKQLPFFEDAEKVIAAGYFGDATLWVSTQSLKDAYYVLAHYIRSDRVQRSMSKLLEVVTPVDLTGGDVTAALGLMWGDFEDCLIAMSAAKAKADYLVTRDEKGFDRSMVPVVTPAEWLSIMHESHSLSYSSIDF